MLMNLGGVLTDLPLYDQNGNVVSFTDDFTDDMISFIPDFDANNVDTKVVTDLRESVQNILDCINSPLILEDAVNIYDDPSENSEYYSIMIHGGDKDAGSWSTYLLNLHDLLERLEETYLDAWIIKVDTDVSSDTFMIEIGIKLEEFGIDS